MRRNPLTTELLISELTQ